MTSLLVTDSFSSFSTDDLSGTRLFLAEILGLDVTDNSMGLVEVSLPGTKVLVYPKPDHVPASFTVLNLKVPDIDAAVDQLTQIGVRFERYDSIPQDDKLIATEGPRIAWFKDPAGNIFSIVQDVG
jgi:hypothetical protein